MANEVLKVSLRDYKKEIENLKADLLSLDRGTEQYAKTLDELRAKQSKLNEVNADAKKQNDALDGSYAALSQQMAALKKEWRETNDVAKRNELGTQINGINTQLKELDASLGNYQRNVGNYEGATVSLKQQLRELNATMAEMLASGIRETDPAFVELAQKAGTIKDAISDAKAVTSEYANDVRGMAIGVDIAKNLAAGYGAITGALHIFGVESKTANEITAKMTVIMTTLNSLQSINKAIMDSASPTRRAAIQLWEALTGAKQKDIVATTEQTISEKAATLNTEANTVAMEANTVATNTATVATNNFKKALIATGIGAIIVLIGTLIAKWEELTKWIKDNTELLKKLGTQFQLLGVTMELIKAKEKELNTSTEYFEKSLDSIGGTVAKDVAKFNNLKSSWANLRNEGEKIKWLKEHRSEMDGLGIAVDDTRSAEVLFTKQAKNVIAGFEGRAMAAAAESLEVEALKDAYIALKNLDLQGIKDAGKKHQDALKMFKDAQAMAAKAATGLKDAGVRLTNDRPETNRDTGSGKTGSGKSDGDTSNNTEKENKALEHQSEILSDINKKRDDALETVRYTYGLINAKGEETTMTERGRIEDEHAIRAKYFEEYMKQLEADLNSTEFNAEQKKKIEKDYAKVKEEQTKEAHDYAIKMAANETKARQNEVKARVDAAKNEVSQIKAEYENLRGDIHSKWAEINADLDENDTVQKLKNEQAEREEVYNAQIEAFNNQIAAAKELLATLDPLSEEYKEIAENITGLTEAENDATEKFNEETAKNQKQTSKEEKKVLQKRVKDYATFAQSIGDLVGTIADVEKARIDKKVKEGKISEKEAEREFEEVKKKQIAMTIMNTLSGAAGGFAATVSDTSIPTFVRWATASAIAAATLLQGYEQVRQIQAQTYGGGAGAAASSTGGGAVQLATSPLLNENLDANSLQEVSVARLGDIKQGQTDQRVYVLETDLQKSAKRVEVRQKNTTF